MKKVGGSRRRRFAHSRGGGRTDGEGGCFHKERQKDEKREKKQKVAVEGPKRTFSPGGGKNWTQPATHYPNLGEGWKGKKKRPFGPPKGSKKGGRLGKGLAPPPKVGQGIPSLKASVFGQAMG